MLIQLNLQNFALIPAAEVEFKKGFTVMTGETGAGKSIVLDALAAAVGERMDAQTVRHGASKADISAMFELNGLASAWLTDRELLNEDTADTVILRRVISSEGRSKAWINGAAVGIGELKELGRLLLSMQGQHSQQQLFESSFARQWLDSQAQLTPLAEQVRRAYHDWQAAKKKLQQSQLEAASRKARITDLEHYLEEFQPLQNTVYADIEQEFDRLSHFESLMQDGSQILSALEEEEESLNRRLAQLNRIASHHAKRDQTFEQVADLLDQGHTHLIEATRLLNLYMQDQGFDASQLEKHEQRLGEFHRLARKHQCAPEALAATSQTWQQSLLELQELDNLPELEQASIQAEKMYHKLALQLEESRQQHAKTIAAELVEKLIPLALPEAQMQFVFNHYPEPQADGLSQIELLFSANRGMPLQPLQKIASGGELSRIALVMQLMNAHQNQHSTLVFDEVDVGIGGATAQVVGQLMRELSRRQQIISITHQPQVAAQGHQHLYIAKHQTEQAQSELTWLTPEQRITELARMSGGVDITPETLAHARTLLVDSK